MMETVSVSVAVAVAIAIAVAVTVAVAIAIAIAAMARFKALCGQDWRNQESSPNSSRNLRQT